MLKALFLSVLISSTIWAQGPTNDDLAQKSAFHLRNLNEFRYGAESFQSLYQTTQVNKKIKIAILDSGFVGYENEIGQSLPAEEDVVFHKNSNPPENNNHGLRMAQAVYALTTGGGEFPQFTPEFHLYSAVGVTNLQQAVEDAIERKVDIILYSQEWKNAGSGDGHGFVNQIVDQATAQGIIWVNASGNMNLNILRKKIRIYGAHNYLLLNSKQNGPARIKCMAPRGRRCSLEVNLNWSDFKRYTGMSTTKDLDLFIADKSNRILSQSVNRQVDRDGQMQNTQYPRETIKIEEQKSFLNPGQEYFIHVKANTLNFSGTDEVTLIVEGNGILFPDATSQNTLLPPADNPTVITVGAADARISGKNNLYGKPEVRTQSRLILNQGEIITGSSSAAAVYAAKAVLHKMTQPNLPRFKLLQLN